MIQELVNFTRNLDEEFKNQGAVPKDGLHILVRKKIENQASSIDVNNLEYAIYSKKIKDLSGEFLEKCKMRHQNAWCIDTNKCFDLPTKAIHTCSPFCVAFKREHLAGGKKYIENEKGKKRQIHERFDTYFGKAFSLLENDTDKEAFAMFKHFFTHNTFSNVIDAIERNNANERSKLNAQIDALQEEQKKSSDKTLKEKVKEKIADLEVELIKVKELEDSDYIIFYLDIPLGEYKKVHLTYLSENLFNTANDITEPNEHGVRYGVSGFFNSKDFGGKKPFSLHQTASFDLSGRISNLDAKLLYDFENILPNRTLPNPLPIFIYKEELQKEVIGIFRESGFKFGYKEIIEKLIENNQEDINNYYLLFWQNTKDGIIFKDFDFVAKFEYKIESPIINLFELKEKGKNENKYYPLIRNIFDFEGLVFKQLLQNKYRRLDYFGDLNKDDYAELDLTFISYSKYRKAVYDFVYKSQRQAVQLNAFHEMIFNGIADDLKYGNEYGIKEKLNIWYSLFDMFNPNKTSINMASKLKVYQDFVAQLITSDSATESATDEQFAFTAGQVISYILDKSKSANTSFQLLEPYLQQAKCSEFKKAIANDFARYKHENFSKNFERVASFALSYETDANMKHLLPEILSGVFSKNQLYSSNPKNQ